MSDESLYPLVFDPILMERVWGGQALAKLGKRVPAGRPVGESWELADLTEASSLVASGALAGTSLRQLRQTRQRELCGPAALDGGSFPLLVKFIDAAQTLSVQVHPDAETAARLGGRPKSEAWYVLDAAPGAVLHLGLKPGITISRLEQAVAEGQVEELLHAVPVSAGDLIPVLPGTVHAIGAGVLLAEVQQPSDTTYRVYDWGRLGLDGKPRPLHLAESLQSVHADSRPQVLRGSGEADLGLFQLRVMTLEPGRALELAGSGPLVLLGLTGTGLRLDGAAASAEDVRLCARGEVVLVPHVCREGRLWADRPASIMAVTFPS